MSSLPSLSGVSGRMRMSAVEFEDIREPVNDSVVHETPIEEQ